MRAIFLLIQGLPRANACHPRRRRMSSRAPAHVIPSTVAYHPERQRGIMLLNYSRSFASLNMTRPHVIPYTDLESLVYLAVARYNVKHEFRYYQG
jgi:hypothetical protein